jgi:hypothetical protein
VAAYPSIGKRTKVRALNDRKTDISEAGTVRIVDLSAAQVYQIAVEHPLLNSTDLATLRTFWTTNKNLVVTISAGDGYSYDAYFVNEPEVEVVNSVRSNVRVTLVGNRL